MRVLVTRPLPAAEGTARRLQAAGHQPIVLPLMQAVQMTASAGAALELPHAAVILTSAEAARVLAALGSGLAKHLATPCLCVGEATARAAQDLGFTDVRTGAGTGEALAELIVATAGTLSQQPLLYLAGTPRSDGLENALRQHGIAHRTVECYRMEPIAHLRGTFESLVQSGGLDAVLIYSRETARRLSSLLSEAGLDARSFALRYLCLSATVAEALPDGVTPEIAARPDEDSLFSLL